MFKAIEAWITSAAYTPWAFVVLATLILIDALIPIVPSESIVIALASIYVHDRQWLLVILAVWAGVFCWLGDNLAYRVGQSRWLHDNRLTRRAKVAKALDWARGELRRRGSTIVIVGRFIPGARIAINVTCGIVGHPRRAFRLATLASATLWATYSCVIGAVAGVWFEQHKLVGIGAAIVLGMVLGPVVDQILRKTVLAD